MELEFSDEMSCGTPTPMKLQGGRNSARACTRFDSESNKKPFFFSHPLSFFLFSLLTFFFFLKMKIFLIQELNDNFNHHDNEMSETTNKNNVSAK